MKDGQEVGSNALKQDQLPSASLPPARCRLCAGLLSEIRDLTRENLNGEVASIRLAYEQIRVDMFLIRIDFGGPRSLWVVLPLGWWFWVL